MANLEIGFPGGPEIHGDGSAEFGGAGEFAIGTGGSLNLNGNLALNADGSALFGQGVFAIDNIGNLAINGIANVLRADGSATFATELIQFAANGVATFVGSGAGSPVTASFNADGSLNLASNNVFISPTGDVEMTNGNLTVSGVVAINGNLVVGVGPNNLLLADGSASLGNTFVNIDTAGNVQATSFTINGGVAQIAPDGSASFATSVVQFAADGSLVISGSGGELDFQTADGILRASGGFGVGPSVGITQDVLISGTTLHFTGGILTSVT